MTGQPWFGWYIVVIIALPVVTVALTELHGVLVRRGNPLAKPLQLLRTYIVPGVAILILLGLASGRVSVTEGSNWVRIVATALGVLILQFVLSALNAMLFVNATQGSWRRRLPTIFIELGRVLLVAIGVAVLLAWIWGADIGGLFAALGVTSIVLGLALQDAVGGVISGLLLLFEQPFAIGDWLEVDGEVGQVVQVNWRAVHLQTFTGTRIIPNSSLSKASFANHSQPPGSFYLMVTLAFSESDPPQKVIRTLTETAADISPELHAGAPKTIPLSPPTSFSHTPLMNYCVMVPMKDFADHWGVRTELRTRAWYAARRAGLAFNGVRAQLADDVDEAAAALRRFAPRLHIEPEQAPELASRMRVERYAAGEIVLRAGRVPSVLSLVVEGEASATIASGAESMRTLREGDYLGHGAVTRTAAVVTITATTELTLLAIPCDMLDELVRDKPTVTREIGQQIEQWNREAANQLA
ncbi:mechanosensitive ion channel [Saccharopolyspora sp. TS4A08]|uniref:Mechanosensitive ion channel n=1 Tax=Saccharopolyspora ipomoeae TaxID=3042027 RepID=A0ABT6PJK7_9PSEU|nr:mechanosensitive ion channel domain-containing protein [Saccharopolyspora sp. TS4A08]MDI2028180.1 mechanosensitive ion channel [Saccharopolyspora sp. TS4A08]